MKMNIAVYAVVFSLVRFVIENARWEGLLPKK